MKMKSVGNALIVGSILLIAYVFAGHDYVSFYLGGKAELLEAAESINRQCAANGACPTELPGWQPWGDGRALAKGNMLYFASKEAGDKPQTFRLVYRFFMPDDWFEAAGGVDKPVTAGWKSRP